MPFKSNPSKRKASVSTDENNNNKTARTSNSCDAPTSQKQGLCLTTLSYSVFHVFFCYTEIVGEMAGRAVRSNRGQGGHAYQLEKALNPTTGERKANQGQLKLNQGIPENVPENVMAPPALRKARLGKKAVISVFYCY
jgi:hypothetical protein